MVSIAEPLAPVTTDDFETDPWLLNVQNGTLDLRSATFRPHDRNDFMLSIAGAKFDDEAKCPRWRSFVDEIMDGDKELVDYLQRLAGYWATGAIREHILPVFYGSGGNGKSVYLNSIQSVLGSFTMKAGKSFLMATKHEQHPTACADLYRKRLAIAIETDENRRLDEALVKELTGGDRVRARRMREDFWEFSPTHKLVLCTNHKPRVFGTDDGIWRRISLVPFTVQIPPDEQDPELTNKLRDESSGILNWIIAGCVKWQADGLTRPKAVEAATAEYRTDSDTIGEFLYEKCVIADESYATGKQLFDAYKDWNGQMDKNRFGQCMSERFEKRKVKGVFSYYGVGIRERGGDT